jgi:uncharacterized protein YcfJ
MKIKQKEMFIMNKNSKDLFFSVAVVVGALGGIYIGKKINNHLDNRRKKRELEIWKIKDKWHTSGFAAGYEAGKMDASFEKKNIMMRINILSFFVKKT